MRAAIVRSVGIRRPDAGNADRSRHQNDATAARFSRITRMLNRSRRELFGCCDPLGSGLPMTHEFDDVELSKLSYLGTKVRIEAGTALFNEGDEGDALYIVLSGQLRIVHGRTVYETVVKGGAVGEMAIVQEAYPRSAGVIAVSPSELLRIDRHTFLSLVSNNPEFTLKVMRVCSHRLRKMNQRHLRRPASVTPASPDLAPAAG